MLNPFVWNFPIDDPGQVIGMDTFAREVALILKGRTNVALFGPRDTGKTTFTAKLIDVIHSAQGSDAPPWLAIRINLERAFSIPAFTAAVVNAMETHHDVRFRKEARKQLGTLEREVGFDLKLLHGGVRHTKLTDEQTSETLHIVLSSLPRVADGVVVIFDEFQRLNRCPGHPFAIIRSALLSGDNGKTALMMTGSVREALQMIFTDSTQPLFGEAKAIDLPTIAYGDFFDALEHRFQNSGKPATEEAIEWILKTMNLHPMRVQQLAWETWNATAKHQLPITATHVEDAYQHMLHDPTATAQLSTTFRLLAEGKDSEVNELRALFVLADRGSVGFSSNDVPIIYGFKSRSAITVALERLKARGLVAYSRKTGWQIVDPLLTGWLNTTHTQKQPNA